MKYKCVLCDKLRDQAGGLIFGPPIGTTKMVSKDHVCRPCYAGPLFKFLHKNAADRRTGGKPINYNPKRRNDET